MHLLSLTMALSLTACSFGQSAKSSATKGSSDAITAGQGGGTGPAGQGGGVTTVETSAVVASASADCSEVKPPVDPNQLVYTCVVKTPCLKEAMHVSLPDSEHATGGGDIQELDASGALVGPKTQAGTTSSGGAGVTTSTVAKTSPSPTTAKLTDYSSNAVYNTDTNTFDISGAICSVAGTKIQISAAKDRYNGKQPTYTYQTLIECGPPVGVANKGMQLDDCFAAPAQDPAVKTCASLNVTNGDECKTFGETCVVAPAQACASDPTKVQAAATLLVCQSFYASEARCPVSRRQAKTDIAYLSDQERTRLANLTLGLKLAHYHYLPTTGLDQADQMGFIIDDHPTLPFLTTDKGHVNMYGYVSALVATIQAQEERLERLEKLLQTQHPHTP